MSALSHPRPPAIAGSWYPGDRQAIEREVTAYLDAVPRKRIAGRLVALISPHAGLVYSGPVAAHGYAQLTGSKNLTVVMIGPSHRYAFAGVALYARGSWRTPLGEAAIDEDLAARLLADQNDIVAANEPHQEEHCLEIQLPFLQYLIAGLRIVPLLMGDQSRTTIDRLSMALHQAVAGRSDVLLLASSDLSHYHSAEKAHRLDAQVVEAIGRFDADGLQQTLQADPDHACGGGPIVSVMRAASALGANESVVLHYGDSGDAGPRDKRRVVGYVSAALIEKDRPAS
ncbi:MAG: AmmeMemoRadiSam system protein B [Vicinamibacteria bacterium]|jgi:hypothetical protein|nr:AmmeMemoRadiSam system protein B [Vicinamibacteria bacterium]